MSEGTRHEPGTESTKDVALEEAGNLKEDVKREAGIVADEAKRQGRELLGETKERLREEADQQAGRTASGLKSMSNELRSMADNSEQPQSGLASWIRRGADEIDSFAGRLDRDGIDGVMRDVSDFARRNPTTFLVTTFGAGLVAGRLMKNRGGEPILQDDQQGYRREEPVSAALRQPQGVSPSAGETSVTERTSP
jgi:hypothetical protein